MVGRRAWGRGSIARWLPYMRHGLWAKCVDACPREPARCAGGLLPGGGKCADCSGIRRGAQQM